jgi:hypothetical protein
VVSKSAARRAAGIGAQASMVVPRGPMAAAGATRIGS